MIQTLPPEISTPFPSRMSLFKLNQWGFIFSLKRGQQLSNHYMVKPWIFFTTTENMSKNSFWEIYRILSAFEVELDSLWKKAEILFVSRPLTCLKLDFWSCFRFPFFYVFRISWFIWQNFLTNFKFP